MDRWMLKGRKSPLWSGGVIARVFVCCQTLSQQAGLYHVPTEKIERIMDPDTTWTGERLD